MISRYRNRVLIGLLILTALAIPASATYSPWSYQAGCWTAKDPSTGYNLTMWNATATSSWDVPAGVTTVEYLVIAGGGGGASGYYGGGGGAGGFRTATGLAISGTITVTVGIGGAAGAAGNPASPSNPGGASVFGSITSAGGGYGGRYSYNGGDGGSGGGGGSANGVGPDLPGGIATPANQGYNGGAGASSVAGGGGGGANELGYDGVDPDTPGNGGNGKTSIITGSSVSYAGGGGGGASQTPFGTGGIGGGGNGGDATHGATSATANTGGGGGGSGMDTVGTGMGGDGGSGIIIIKYLLPTPAPVAAFHADKTAVVRNGTIQLIDDSLNAPETLDYYSPGSNPCFVGNLTNTNPLIFPRNFGSCSVCEIASNSAGDDTECKTGYLYVAQPQAVIP